MERKDELTLLGNKKTVYKQDYAPEVLESFVNKHPENDYWVRFNCPEFTAYRNPFIINRSSSCCYAIQTS